MKGEKCPACGKERLVNDGCSRVECPLRRPVTAAPVGATFPLSSGATECHIAYRKLPTTKE